MKLLLVEWADHYSGSTDWEDVAEAATKPIEPLICRSVGWVLSEDKQHLVLIANLDGSPKAPQDRRGFGVMTIIKKAIVKKTVLG